jgi:hypothetical protein
LCCCRELPYWQYFCDYFPAVLIKEADLDPAKNYIFGYHPHGTKCRVARQPRPAPMRRLYWSAQLKLDHVIGYL